MPLITVSGLPVLAVGRVGLRRVGLVVLDRLRRVRFARVLDLRRKPTTSARLDTIGRHALKIVRAQNVGTLVLEAETARSPSPPGFRDVLRHVADQEGAWLQERGTKTALGALGHDSSRSAVAELAVEYPQLAARLDFHRPSLFRDRDHERDVRPLVSAFILAHAVSLEAARAATRRPA